MGALTYQKAGVDIEAADKFVTKIGNLAQTTYNPSVVGGIGGFAALYALDITKYQEPLLVSSTDGVGTKLLLAQTLHQLQGIGTDLVAMCVNDILTVGAQPLFFLDYFATGKLEERASLSLMEGITRGCKEAGCSLIGGETAEMPGLYQKQDFDLAGFAVGVVERKSLIDGKAIRAGDIVLGISSNGLHSNGFSLVRHLLLESKGHLEEKDLHLLQKPLTPGNPQTWGEILLTPTRIYTKSIQQIIENFSVHGLAHITGGGLPGNLSRIVPQDFGVKLQKSSWKIPKIFHLLQERGKVSDDEMFKTFNMGIGMGMILSPKDADRCHQMLRKNQEDVNVIGEIIPRKNDEPQFQLIE